MTKNDAIILKQINSGKCFLLVGSGASIDSGYPNWKDLVEQIFNQAKSTLPDDDQKSIINLLSSPVPENLIKVLDVIEKRNSKTFLVDIVKDIFDKIEPKQNDIYSIISQWPINCYLTTNFDNELKNYLDKTGTIFLEKGNSKIDFATIKSDDDRQIIKIHGKLDDPNSIVITESDYNRIIESEEYKYWNDRIASIINICPLIMLGYSASDPDFKIQLERAQTISSPDKPVFMFASEVDTIKIQELKSKFNIHIIPYSNTDGKHTNLKKLLHQYDQFIPKRNSGLIGKTKEQLKNSELASSLFIYESTVLTDESFLSKAMMNCILYLIDSCSMSSIEQLIKALKDNRITIDQRSIETSYSELKSLGYIEIENSLIKTTSKGKSFLAENIAANADKKNRFIEYCKNYLKGKNAPQETIDMLEQYMLKGLNILFEKRGLEITKKIMLDDENEVTIAFDIAEAFESILNELSLQEYDLFIDLILTILQTPNKEVKDYFAILCNSYFIYHILGYNAEARNQRLTLLNKYPFFIDSNVLLPALADNSQNCEFVRDLIDKIKKINSEIYITENLFKEVINHASWVIKNFAGSKACEMSLFQAGQGIDGYRQNLFAQGGISWCEINKCQMFDSYLEKCFGENYEELSELEDHLLNKINSLGIKIYNATYTESAKYYTFFEEAKEKITCDRKANNTFRNDLQCETEADLLSISQNLKFNFLTLTNNLKKMDATKKIRHCSPEALYRFILLNENTTNLETLYECMISDLYSCGFPVITAELLNKLKTLFYTQPELNLKEMIRIEGNQIKQKLSQNLIDESKENLTYHYMVSQFQHEIANDYRTQKEQLEKENRAIAENIKKNELINSERTELEKYRNKIKRKEKQNANKRKRKKKRNKKQ